MWEATVIEPRSKFLVQSELGQRNEDLGRRLLLGARQRLANPHDLVLFTDVWAVYESLFPEVFGVPYRAPRKGSQEHFKKLRFRVPRTLAHVLIIKRRVVEVLQRIAHGSWSRVDAEVEQLGYQTPNTSAVERLNGTSTRMNAFEARKSLAFARTSLMRRALSQLCMGCITGATSSAAYVSSCLSHRDGSSTSSAPQLWLSASARTSGRSLTSFAFPSTEVSKVPPHCRPSLASRYCAQA
ncbi:hypothetical protein [Deinococcus peraridilitoris]|nr:hypothetical protein [Deinococcus peraridilitoris]